MAVDKFATCDKACVDAQMLIADFEYAIRLLSNTRDRDLKRMEYNEDLVKTRRSLFSPSKRIKNEQVDDAYTKVTHISMHVGDRLRDARNARDMMREKDLTDISRKLSHISTRLKPYSTAYQKARRGHGRKKQQLSALAAIGAAESMLGLGVMTMAAAVPIKIMSRMADDVVSKRGKKKKMCGRKVGKNVLKAMGARK